MCGVRGQKLSDASLLLIYLIVKSFLALCLLSFVVVS